MGTNLKRIIIEGDDGNLQLLAKIATQNETVRQLVKTAGGPAFMNEHIMYTEYLLKLEQLPIEAGVPKTDRLRYAKFCGSSTQYLNELILLEDVLSEFTILDKFVSMTDGCVRSVLKNIAILHSLSYLLKYREPEIFNDFKSKLCDIRSIMTKEGEVYMKQFENNILSVLDEDRLKYILKSRIANWTTDMIALAKLEYNKNPVILQGDAWTNNFMFRYKENQLLESMIDYQLSKNGNPVYDVSFVRFMMFNCTDYETRSKYCNWTNLYLILTLKQVQFPRNVMDADMKRYADLDFRHCCVLCNIVMRTCKESVEMMDAIQASNDFSDLLGSVKTDKILITICFNFNGDLDCCGDI